jgi:hypothetical protein
MDHSVIDSTVVLKIFEIVVQARSVTLREILEALNPEEDERVEMKPEIQEALDWLVEKGLVKVGEAPIEDFSIYYVTSDGLLAWSQLKGAGLLDKDEPASRLIAG